MKKKLAICGKLHTDRKREIFSAISKKHDAKMTSLNYLQNMQECFKKCTVILQTNAAARYIT